MRPPRIVAALVLGLAVGLLGGDARAQVPSGTFASIPTYSSSGQAAVVFGGGSVDQLKTAARGANAGGVWAQDRIGAFELLVIDAPAFLEEAFRARFPSGLATSTAVTLIRANSAIPPTTTPPPPAGAAPRPVALEATSERTWQRPVEMGPYPIVAGNSTYFVLEQDGAVWAVEGGVPSRILDISDRISRASEEEGLLSMAVDPDFGRNRHVWIYYAAANPRRTVLARFTRNASDLTIDRNSELVVLEVPQPFGNHKGGAIRFGGDGMLYLGLGDGGSSGDPQGNGQSVGTLLGQIIRIDVRGATTAQRYTVPADNPFVGQSGARGEIWAYGLRNPWRMAFDPVGGALWAGDVGQGAVEEVDIVQRGANYGWSVVEGGSCYKPASGCDRTGLTSPVLTYDHAGGRCSITGGYVYRGTKVPEIAGAYIYGDLCSGEIWAVRADSPGTPVRIASGPKSLTSFGIDPAGELYVLAIGQPIRRLVSPAQ